MSDEHRRPDTPLERRAYRAAVAAFGAAVAGGIVSAYAYWTDRTELLLGLGLAAALGGIGVGLVNWANSLGLGEHDTQEREPLTTTALERAKLDDEVRRTAATFGRRPVLLGLFSGSILSTVVAFIGPIGSLGPKPRGELSRTAWRAGRRLVTDDGEPIDVSTGGFDQLVTVFPEGYVGRDDSQVVLLRVQPELLTDRTVEGGAVQGWVAYSKICTHAGCSVGLFGIDDRPPHEIRQLVCPCHQSVFDPVDGARPVGGPAPRSLPQLRLGVDHEDKLISLADFDRPVGPIAWDEG